MKLKRFFWRSLLSLWSIPLIILVAVALVTIRKEKTVEIKRELESNSRNWP